MSGDAAERACSSANDDRIQLVERTRGNASTRGGALDLNPYDARTLASQLGQTTLLQDIGVKPSTAMVDLTYRGVDGEVAPVQVIHRGKSKRLGAAQKAWVRRRQAIEPVIGHLKADHRMDRCWLKGSQGDALHAVLCAAGFNIRWLLRAIAERSAKAAKALFFGGGND